MANLGTLLHTFLHGKLVGEDEFGNRYYTEKKASRAASGKARRYSRWVVYKGEVEATRIPAYWHGWMHHTTDAIPQKGAAMPYRWQEESAPNATGSAHAYLPGGHTLKHGQRTQTVTDYEPWQPS